MCSSRAPQPTQSEKIHKVIKESIWKLPTLCTTHIPILKKIIIQVGTNFALHNFQNVNEDRIMDSRYFFLETKEFNILKHKPLRT